jgi:hypothetical protein
MTASVLLTIIAVAALGGAILLALNGVDAQQAWILASSATTAIAGIAIPRIVESAKQGDAVVLVDDKQSTASANTDPLS